MMSKFNPTIHGFLLLVLAGLAGAHSGWAQEKKQEKIGGSRRIADVQVEIVRERRIALPEVSRNFEKIPPRSTASSKPKLSYNFRNLKFTPPTYSLPLHPMKIKQENISKTYGNFISAGFGNYISPYLEVSFNSKRNEKKFYGTHIYHRSSSLGPVDDENSAFFDSDIKAFGVLYGKVISGSARINYNNKAGYFYGYTPGLQVRRDTIQQVYHMVSIGGTIKKIKTSRFDFLFDTDVSYLVDRSNTTEIEFSARFEGRYTVSQKNTIFFSSNYFLIRQKEAAIQEKLRHLFKAKPVFQFKPIADLVLTAGVNMIVENDTIEEQLFHVYPDINVKYNILKWLSVYAAVSGDFDKVSLHKLAAENFWVNSNLNIFHTNKSYEFSLGLLAKAGKRINLQAGFARVDLKSWYMYQNSPEDRAKFDIIYDDVERLNFFTKVSYEKNERIMVNLRADYFQYKTERSSQPWHKPTYQITLNSFFDLYRKVTVNLDFIGRGGMYRFEPESTKAIELDPALELNLKISYFLSKQFSVFLKLENILSSNYPIYLNYKARGFQALVGVNWSF